MGNAAKDNSDAGSSIVLGNGASVAQSVTSNGIAIGTKAEVANTNGGVAIGNGAKATNSNGGDGSPVAVGQSAEATGTQAVAIGYNAKASGNQVGQTVVGSTASATANYGTIIGYGATGTNTQANQTAIGYLATTNAAGGVALGANSNSNRPYDSTSATSPYIPTGASDEQTNRINATKATTGAVSVGYTDSSDSSKNVRRQIINVAAGKEDTDAVNVAQLKAVQSQSASAGDLWTAQASGQDVKAANQRVNFVGKTNGHITVERTKDGEITFEATGLADTSLSNITGAGNTVINDIAAKAVKVVNGTNTTVTPGTEKKDNGDTITTYAVNVSNEDIQNATDVKGTNGIGVTSSTAGGKKTYTVSAKLASNLVVDQTSGNIDLADVVNIGGTYIVKVDGNVGDITGLTNKTLDADDFAKKGRAATEEQLNLVYNTASQHTKVSAEGTTPTDENYVGGTNAEGNILANVTTNNGAKVYDLKLNKDVVLGEKEAKKGGSITVNNVAQFRKSPESTETYDVGEAVKIDGNTVSIVKVGTADAETGETNEQRQVVLGIGQNTGGYIALNDSTGKKHTYIYNAISDGNTYLNSDTSKQFNRLEYSDYLPESVQFIATLGDGMKYAGDDGQGETEAAKKQVISKELNNQLDIIGGATAKDAQGNSLLTDNNIGVNNVDGKLKIQLVKDIDLTQDGSVKMGNTTINNGGVTINHSAADTTKNVTLTNNGLDNGGNKIINVTGGTNDTDAVNVAQLKNSRTTVKSSDQSINVNVENEGANKNHVYDIKVNYDNVAENTHLSYKANNGTAKTVTLDQGLNFTNGTNTTAVVDDNGVVKFDVADSTIKDKAREAVIVEAGANVTVDTDDTTTADTTKYKVSAADMRVKEGQATYNGVNGTATLTMNDGSTATINGLKNEYVNGATVATTGSNKNHITLTHASGESPIDIDLNGVLAPYSMSDYQLVGSTATTGADGKTTYSGEYKVGEDGSVTLNVADTKGNGQLETVKITGLASTTDIENAKTHYYSVTAMPFTEQQLGEFANFTNYNNDGAKKMGSLAAGYLTYANGIASTVTGSLSGVINRASTNPQDFRGATAVSYGTFNINDNSANSGKFSGVANSIVGQANMTSDSNASLIYGAGNVITNSYRDIDASKLGDIVSSQGNPQKLGEALQAAVPQSGGQVMAFGGGNTVDTAYMTQVIGVGNTVKGDQAWTSVAADAKEEDKKAAEESNKNTTQLNYVDGFYTKLTNGKNDYLIGAHNTVTGDSVENNKSNIVFGDNHTLENRSNNIIIGSAKTEDTPTQASNAVIIGHNANASVDDGVAIGAESVANMGVPTTAGYDPSRATHKSTDAAWTATKAAVSIGNATKGSDGEFTGTTRQITNVAAGAEDTDAVNVAQLKQLKSVVDTVSGNHTKVTVEGGTAPKGQTYVGKNLKINVTNNGGQATYDLKLADNLNIGEKGADGKNGVDGKIGVNGKDGSAVVINGKDGSIGLNGKDGANGLTIRGAAGKPGVDGKDGITRIVYKDANGKDHPVATLDDGLKFKGDTGDVITKKLNETLTIKGGQTDQSKLSTGKNVGVINEKGALRIELAKNIDLSDEGSVKTGDTIINNKGLTIKNGPTITKTNVSMNNQQIHNVAAGKKGTDAVNVDQLNEVQQLASKHTKVTVEGGTAPKGQTYVGKNLKINVTNNGGQATYDLKLADNLNIGEKGADGKNGVDGKIGVNGKDGSAVVINGKDGSIGLNGKDGANGLTIRGAAGKPGVDGTDGITRIVYKDAKGKDHPVATLDDGLNFKGDDSTVISKKLNQRLDIVGGANKNNLSENNIGVISDNGKLHVKLAKDLKNLTSVTTTDGTNTTVQNGKGVTVKDGQNNTSTLTAKDITFTNSDKSHKTKLDEDGLTIFTKGGSGQSNQTIKITNTYISMGGQQIHNVAAGKADTDAVNVSQLKEVKSVAEAHSTVSVGGKKAGKDGVDVKGGNLVLKRTENANGSKNYDVKLADDISVKSVTTTDDKGNTTVQKGSGVTTIDKDGNKTSLTGKGVTTVDKDGNKTSLTGKGVTTVDKDGNKTSVTGKGVSISGKDGNKTTITEKGLTIKGGPSVTKDGISAGDKKITHVADGEISATSKDAINGSQLHSEIQKIEQHHTEVTVNGGTEAQEGTYNESGNLQIKKTTDKETGKKTYDIKLADKLNFGAKDGVDGSIGVNGKDGSAVVINGKDGSIGLNGADGKNGLTIKGADGTVGVDGKDGKTRLIYETKDGETTVKHEVATMDDGLKFVGDDGQTISKKLNETLSITGGQTDSSKLSTGANVGVVNDNGGLKIELSKNLTGLDSITTGNTTINNDGLTIHTGDSNRTITVQDGHVNMGGNKIENVAPGKVSQNSTDAVNGSQLWQRDQAINGLSGSVNKLGNRINRVGAGATALAALHPLDFDPDDKWDFAAGYGNYRGANAAAIGAYYRPNEDTMFSVGGSFGGGENMVNAGVSIKLGQGNHVSTSRVAMAKEMKAMRQHMAEQDALIAKLQSMHGLAVDPTKSTLFPDVAENHWAYQYVTTLAKKGILEGYPDGEFKGDRMMTRYEFAAIVYRIVESGVGSTDPELSKLVKEFSPELQYIRIDTIQKDRNGKPTIERVRVISDAK